MPQFVITAKDYTDSGALERRMGARAAHIAYCDECAARKELLVGAAILDEQGKMIGSTLIVSFESRECVDAWLAKEPYVTAKVWEDVTVVPCLIGPTFRGLFGV